MGIFTSLSRDQKEATAILQIGTFLEYFDLMLYVHMAVLLNELFFPKTDPHTANLISAMTFCSTFIFRPFGALIFGYIGDTIGRKATVIITTAMMAICCLTMANLPTYSQIGILAAWAVTICRIVQGLSSMGEIIGAQIYLTELTKPPIRYPVVSLLGCATCFGTMMALAVGTAVLRLGLEWRIAFWFGAIIAIVGFVARTALRETPDFVNAKINYQNKIEKLNVNKKFNKKTAVAYFLIQCSRPVCIYFCYIYCGNLLKNLFFYSSEQVIYNNFIVAALDFVGVVFFTYLSHKVYPLKIVKIKMIFFAIFILFLPFILSNSSSPWHILCIQLVMCLCATDSFPADAIFFVHFPILKRFTYASFAYALSRAVMYLVTAFGLAYLIDFIGNYGLLIIFIPVVTGFCFAVLYFDKLEKERESEKVLI